jgi:hypothetical protein
LVAAYGVSEVAPAAEAAPELPFLREKFHVKPSLTKGELVQQADPIELVIDRNYIQYWPRQADRSRTASDNLYLMKTSFHPGQLLYGEADREAVEAMKKIKMRLTRGAGESAGSPTSSSRRSREWVPAASPPASGGRFRLRVPGTEKERSAERGVHHGVPHRWQHQVRSSWRQARPAGLTG